MNKISEVSSVYVCGPLTDLLPDKQESVKRIYVQIARLAKRITGVRGFVPHEHCDPKIHSYLQPEQVDFFERDRISKKTSCLVALVIAPSWGGGIEIEIAYRSKVPCILLIKKGENTSRLLRGNPGIAKIIQYTSIKDALIQLTGALRKYKKNFFRQSRIKSPGWNKQIVRSQRLLTNQSLPGFPFMKERAPKDYKDKKYLILEKTGIRMIGFINDSSEIINGDLIWESLGGIYCDLTSIAGWHLINDKSAYISGATKKKNSTTVLIRQGGTIVAVHYRAISREEIFILGDYTNIGKILSFGESSGNFYAIGNKLYQSGNETFHTSHCSLNKLRKRKLRR